MFFSRPKVVIRKREEHRISRKNIDPDALSVLYRLSNAGFTAYLVGGGVRDLLLGRQPKDFDVSTDAHPAQIRKLFHNCFLIGRRFRLAHIIFGRKVIETSTFRKPPEAAEADEAAPGGLYQHEDNTFGTPEEDAKRRDFTINGLFYDIRTFSVIDYVGGLRDLERRTLRVIGDPNVRFREDPVRMMRAVRFAARLGFEMDWACRRALRRHATEIRLASTPRLLEETMRLFGHGCSAQAFKLLWEYGLMAQLLPDVHAYVEEAGGAVAPLWRYLEALDNDPINAEASNGLRLAVLYAPIYEARVERLIAAEEQMRPDAMQLLAQETLGEVATRLKVPRQGCYNACAFQQGQRRLTEAPHHGRRLRLGHRDLFAETVALRRIVLRATGGDLSTLHPWETQAAQLARQNDEPRAPRNPATPPEASDALEPDHDAAPDVAARRPRRRRRGGRGHRREQHQPQADAAQPHSPNGGAPASADAPPVNAG